MHLHKQECVVKTFHHHPFIFFVRIIKILVASLPFIFMSFLIGSALSASQLALILTVIITIFILFIAYDFIIFYLDRLVVTNRRIVHIDWKSLLSRSEQEAELEDIQDIETEENGIFSKIKLFDFGSFWLQTASTKTTITFTDAPDPEGIKKLIYQLQSKSRKMENASLVSSHDSAPKTPHQKTP